MIVARIKKREIIYDSVVFAVSYKSGKNQFVVFDELHTKLIVIKTSWNSDIKVIFLNYDCSDYKINDEKFKVYWNNKNIFKLVKNQKYDFEMLENAKELQSKINYSEWCEIKNEHDLKSLIFSVGDFHDARVIKILETKDYTEILIDTTWGFYVLLKCYDIIENSLDLNYFFLCCTYHFNNGIIEIHFDDEFCELKKLKCKKIEYKYYFEKRCNVKKVEIKDDFIIFNHNLTDELKINLKEINQKIFSNNKIINIGMKEYCEELSSYTFALDDTFIVARFWPKKTETIEYFKKRFSELEDLLLKKDCNFYNLYQDDFIINEWKKFGNILYQEEYNKIRSFLYTLKFALIPLCGNILFWLVVQLCNPQMKWLIFWIFGIGISLSVLIYLIICFLNYRNFKITLTLYEDSFVFTNVSSHYSIAYSSIINIKLRKRIIVTTKFKKYKLLYSKNNKTIFEIIKKRISEIKNR